MNVMTLDDELTLLLSEARSKGYSPSRRGTSWSEKDLLQLAQKLDLGLERTAVLLIKHRWQDFAGKRERGAMHQEVNISADKRDFDPDPAGLFDLLQEYDGLPSANGYSQEDFRDLVRTAVLNDIHMVSVRSKECEHFVEGIRVGRKVLLEANVEVRERLCEVRSRWVLRCEKHGDLLLSLANQELANARVNQEFMLTYGSTYTELEELAHTANSLRTRIRLKESNPDLTATKLDELMSEQAEQERLELEELRSWAVLIPPINPAGAELSAERVEEYRSKAKAALRRLWLLLHPDRLQAQRPADYAKLSSKQRGRLDDIWNEIMKVRLSELAFAPGQLGYAQRSLERILQAEREAKAILQDIPGIDLDARYQVQGATVEERIQWYETECHLLDEDITNVRAQLKALIDSPDIQERRATVALPPEHQDEIRQQMKEQIERFREIVGALQERLNDLMKRQDVETETIL